MGKPRAAPTDLRHAVSRARWRALFADDVKGDAALASLRALATKEGRAAIVEAARDVALDVSAWPSGEPPAELAARLLCEASESSAIRAVIARAEARVRRAPPVKPSRAYAIDGVSGVGADGASDARPRFDAEALRAFEREVAAWAAGERRASYVRARVIASDAEQTTIEVLRAEPAERGLAIAHVVDADLDLDHDHDRDPDPDPDRKGDPRPRLVSSTPLVTDVLHYDALRATLTLTTSDRATLPLYRAAFARAFLPPTASISLRPTCTLAPLQRSGAAALALPAKRSLLKSVTLIHLVWRSGDGVTLTLHAPDVFAALEARSLSVAGGHWHSAMLRFDFGRADPPSVDVQVQPPHRVHHERTPHDALVLETLDALGVTTPAPAAPDLWTLASWIRPADAWKAALGAAAFERMRARKILVRARAPSAVHPDHEAHGPLLVAYPLDGDASYGIPAQDDDVPAKTLRAADLDALQLDRAALARAVGADLEIRATPYAIERTGIFDLGARVLGPASVRVFLFTEAPDTRGLAERLRRLASPAHAVVLTPRGRRTNLGLTELALPPLGAKGAADEASEGDDSDAETTFATLLPRIVKALNLADDVDPVLTAPPGTELVLDRSMQRAWLSGVLVDAIPELQWKLLTLLAEAKGKPVEVPALNEALSRRDDDAAARQAKERLIKTIAASFKAQRKKLTAAAKTLIASDARGYRLTVKTFVR